MSDWEDGGGMKGGGGSEFEIRGLKGAVGEGVSSSGFEGVECGEEGGEGGGGEGGVEDEGGGEEGLLGKGVGDRIPGLSGMCEWVCVCV
jgi:hypothetical protein